MAWTNISNALVSVGALPFATTVQALRDNPVAIANGDVGAPRVQNAAIASGAVDATKLATGAGEISWVLGRTAGASVGAVGTYAYLSEVGFTDARAGGFTQSGANLRYAPADTVAPSGTWRLMGAPPSGASPRTSMWLRVA